MSLFNNIEKIKYTGSSSDELVSLLEYILFTDERKGSKYIVFKFKNNIAQILFDIRVEVLQYTEKDQLIERSYLEYTSKGINPLEDFVPKFKFLANSRTKYISVILKYAKYDKIIFEDGKTIDNPLTFKDYTKEVSAEEQIKQIKKKTKKEKRARRKEAKRAKAKRYARKATVKNVKNHNVNKVVLTIASCLSLALVGFGVYSSISHCLTTNEYTFGEFDVKVDRVKGTCSVIEYNGKNSDVIVPSLIGGFKVTAIASETFDEIPSLSSLYIESEYIEFKPYAITDCHNLQSVIVNSQNGYVSSNSIVNCSDLDVFHFDNGIYSKNSIIDCPNLISFSFKDSNAYRIGDIFGVFNKELHVKEIHDYSSSFNGDYYVNIPSDTVVYFQN